MWTERSATFRYTVFGILFGLLFPILATMGDLLVQGLPWSLRTAVEVQQSTPLHWIIDTAPLFLGFFAYLAGKRQDQVSRLNLDLVQEAKERDTTVRQLEALQAETEQQVMERTKGLTTAADVGRAATSILEMGTLTRRVVGLVQKRFDLYYAGLFLVDETGQQAVLEAGTGEAGRLMKERGHALEIGGASMVGMACALRQARIALDVGDEPVRFDNPLLPRTRSEMALPLVVGERVLGALDIQSTQEKAFSTQDIAVLQLVADQVAVAVDNAHKFSREAALLEATSPIYRISQRLTAVSTTDEIVQEILETIAATDVDGGAVGWFLRSPTGRVEHVTFLGSWSREGVFAFPAGVSLPADANLPLDVTQSFVVVQDVTRDDALSEAARSYLTGQGLAALANIPMRSGQQCAGFVSVYRVTPGPFPPGSMQLYEALSDQAMLALERARLLEETQSRAARDRTVSQVTARMRQSLDTEAILRTAANEMRQALGLNRLVIRVAPSQTRDLRSRDLR
ncbi:MAG: GAF domain-containing protein [Anaerolineae bacterium]